MPNNNFKNTDDLESQVMPKPSELLSESQKDGKKLLAENIYKRTWD